MTTWSDDPRQPVTAASDRSRTDAALDAEYAKYEKYLEQYVEQWEIESAEVWTEVDLTQRCEPEAES